MSLKLGVASTSLVLGSRDRSVELGNGGDDGECQQLKGTGETSSENDRWELEDDDRDQEMGGPESEDISVDVARPHQEDEDEDEESHEQHPSSGSTLPTPQSATFPDSATAPLVHTPHARPSARATRSSSRRHAFIDTPHPPLPTPTGFAASKGGSNLAIAVLAPPSSSSSSSGAVTEWVNSPQSNPFNYTIAPQPSPQIPSLSPMTISNPYTSVSGERSAGNVAPNSAGSGPVTPISPYTFPAPPQSHSPRTTGLEGGGNYSAFGKVQNQQSRPRSSSGYDYDVSHTRSRLKRSHDTANGTSHGASTLAAAFGVDSTSIEKEQSAAEGTSQGRARWDLHDVARFYVPPTGPESEVEQAARMATVAASKSGLGAGAFVYKVYHMLLDPPSHPYARFAENGKSFIVYNQAGLSKHILPRHFKHSNFASFVRQLNMYSFHKVNKVGRGQTKAQLEAMPSEFAHPLFEKGKPNQIEQIKRRGPESEQQRVVPRPRSVGEGEGFYERRATRSGSGALPGRRYAEEEEEGDEEEGSRAQSESEYEEERKEDEASPAMPNPGPALRRPVDTVGNSGESAPNAHGAYSAFRPSGPPYLLAAEARATYSATQDPYSASFGAAPPVARPPLHPSQARRQQPPPRPGSHPHEHALHTIATFGPPPSASVPLPERVAILEHQRSELVAALSSSQRSHAELWREVQDEKRKQVALVDLLSEVYGAVQKMNPVDLPYLFPSHVFQSRAPAHPQFGVDTSVSPIEPHTPSISVSPVTSHHPNQQHHRQPKFEPYQQHHLYTPQEQESSGMFASSVPTHHAPPRLIVDPYAHSQIQGPPYSSLTAATTTPLPPSPAVASAPSTSAGAPDHHLVGLGLSHPANTVIEDEFGRGAPSIPFFGFGACARDGAAAAEGREGNMEVER